MIGIQTMKKDIKEETSLPKILGALGTVSALPLFLVFFLKLSKDIKFYYQVNESEFYFFKIFPSEIFLFVLPVLLGIIGVIIIKRSPIMSGTLMFAAGIIILFGYFNSLLFLPEYFLALPGTFLIIGGLLSLMRCKKIKQS